MSKIYEALLRAEIDRLAAAAKEAEGTNSLPAQSAESSAEVIRQPIALSNADRASGLNTQEAAPEARKPDQSDAFRPAFLDPSVIAGVSWKPSLLQLPSLQEMGGSVEQFRGLRSRMHEFRDLNTLKTVLVSSGLPEEGKTFIAANLAISFARYKNSRVLLIDGDMRRGSLHKLLGTHSGPGLTEYLSGKASIPEVMQRPKYGNNETVPKGLSSLTLIPCGADAADAADLSGNGRFDKLLTAVSPLFDWIVVDSSPVNLVADGVNLARYCDGVLLVTRGGVTKFATAQRALGELKASKVIGVVLNAVEKAPAVGGYYGYDSYD